MATSPKEQKNDSGEIDFSGLLDKVKVGRTQSDLTSSQDDLLKSLEGLTLDLPEGRSPDESTDEELDSLLSDFEGTFSKGSKPAAKPAPAPAPRTSPAGAVTPKPMP